jgi:hypothetical protein
MRPIFLLFFVLIAVYPGVTRGEEAPSQAEQVAKIARAVEKIATWDIWGLHTFIVSLLFLILAIIVYIGLWVTIRHGLSSIAHNLQNIGPPVQGVADQLQRLEPRLREVADQLQHVRLLMPVVPSIAPTPLAQRVSGGITIHGNNFQPGIEVMIGVAPAHVIRTSATTLSVLVPPQDPTVPAGPAAGTQVDVRVRNPDGQEAAFPRGFTYL